MPVEKSACRSVFNAFTPAAARGRGEFHFRRFFGSSPVACVRLETETEIDAERFGFELQILQVGQHVVRRGDVAAEIAVGVIAFQIVEVETQTVVRRFAPTPFAAESTFQATAKPVLQKVA